MDEYLTEYMEAVEEAYQEAEDLAFAKALDELALIEANYI